jgi:hypothetical protein
MEKFLMCCIKQWLQRDELKRTSQKKGRVLERTRPEPTIFGNCESWKFIVGKKREQHRRGIPKDTIGADGLFQRFQHTAESGARHAPKSHDMNSRHQRGALERVFRGVF